MKKYKIDLSFYLLIICFLLSPYQNILIYILLVIFIHEAGHLFFVLLFKLEIKSLRLYALGFLMSLNDKNLSFLKELLLYSGGIIFNILSLFLVPNEFHKYIYLIIILNVIPIYPLDGYMIIKTLISYIFPYKISLYIINILGIISLLVASIFLISRLDGLLMINILYLWVIQIKEFKNIKYIYSSFMLNRYLDMPRYKYRKIKFRYNNEYFLYKYNLIFCNVGEKRVEEYDILKLKYSNI